MVKRERKQVGTPRVAPSLGITDPRARNSARLRLGDGLEVDASGAIVSTQKSAEAPAAAAKQVRMRTLSTFAPGALPSTSDIRDKLNEIVRVLIENGVAEQGGGL